MQTLQNMAVIIIISICSKNRGGRNQAGDPAGFRKGHNSFMLLFLGAAEYCEFLMPCNRKLTKTDGA